MADDEFMEMVDWAWDEIVPIVDAKDEQCTDASAHLEVFVVMASIMATQGWTRDEMMQILDEGVFDDTPSPQLH